MRGNSNTRAQAKPRRTLLVLDLDETLLYGTETPFERPPDITVCQYSIYKRPHVDEFLATCLAMFDVAIWSSASANYVEAIASALFPDQSHLVFMWSSKRCTYRYNYELQDYLLVKKLKTRISRIRTAVHV